MFRDRLQEIRSQTEAEKQWWEKRKASIKEDFMKELDGETDTTKPKAAAPVAKSVSDEDTVVVERPVASTTNTPSSKKKKGKK
jgi:translocation protein SEC66